MSQSLHHKLSANQYHNNIPPLRDTNNIAKNSVLIIKKDIDTAFNVRSHKKCKITMANHHLQFILKEEVDEKVFPLPIKTNVHESKLVRDTHVLNSHLSDGEESINVENVIKSKTSSTIGAISPVVSLDVTQHTVSDLKNKTSLNDSIINADKSLSVIDTDGENNFNAGVVQEIQKKKSLVYKKPECICIFCNQLHT